VVVQAFTPFIPTIQYARRHDYTGFYTQEIEFRPELSTRPSAASHSSPSKAQRRQGEIRRRPPAKGTGFGVERHQRPGDRRARTRRRWLRAQTFYRYHIMLRTRQMSGLSTVGCVDPALALMEASRSPWTSIPDAGVEANDTSTHQDMLILTCAPDPHS